MTEKAQYISTLFAVSLTCLPFLTSSSDKLKRILVILKKGFLRGYSLCNKGNEIARLLTTTLLIQQYFVMNYYQY